MKRLVFAATAAMALVLTACGEEKVEEAPAAQPATSGVLETSDQKLSYIVGYNMARQFKNDGVVTLDIAALSEGIKDLQGDVESKLSEAEIEEVYRTIQQRGADKQKAELDALAAKNKADGEAYLAENGKKEGVVTTESGLQYQELSAGDGAAPTAEDTVTVHYKGTLIDGTVFDSSYDRGQPATFPVNRVIPGWIEALQLMNVGDNFRLVIPSDLAYGVDGTGPVIGPNSTLIFEVELLEIAAKEEAEEASPAQAQ